MFFEFNLYLRLFVCRQNNSVEIYSEYFEEDTTATAAADTATAALAAPAAIAADTTETEELSASTVAVFPDKSNLFRYTLTLTLPLT